MQGIYYQRHPVFLRDFIEEIRGRGCRYNDRTVVLGLPLNRVQARPEVRRPSKSRNCKSVTHFYVVKLTFSLILLLTPISQKNKLANATVS